MTTDKSKPRNSPTVWFIWLIVVLLLPLAYVLSTGPYAWLSARGLLSDPAEQFFIAFYYPLRAIVSLSPQLGKLIDFYMSLWR